MTWNKRTVTLAGLAAIGIGVFVWAASRPEYVPVDLVTITAGPMEVTVNAEGRTRIKDVYELSAPVSGQLERSPVAVGDAVVAGKTLVARIAPGDPAFLDDRARAQAMAAVAQAQAAVSVADAQIAMAEADLAHAQTALNRLHDLHARGTIPKAQLDSAELGVDVAAAKLDSAHAAQEMRLAELAAQKATLIEPGARDVTAVSDACCVEIYAPVSGMVLSVANESARAVMPGAPILSIGQTDALEIEADILSTDAVRLTTGARAYVERWGGAGVLEAHVSVIEPSGFTKMSALGIEEQRVRVVLDLYTPPEARGQLGHAFRTYLRIVEWQGGVTQVPLSALFRDGDSWAVFTLDGEHAVLQHVDIGRQNSDMAELLMGPAEGARVIAHPSDRVMDGVLVVDRDTL